MVKRAGFNNLADLQDAADLWNVPEDASKAVNDIASPTGATASSSSASVAALEITYLPIERLRPSENNARTHSKKQLKQIARSIERFGFVNPVLISDDGEIIAGHGRVEAAKLLGLRQVPAVRLSNLSAAERRAYIIADNRLAERAGWDREVLAGELKGLLDLQFDDVELTGFSLAEVDVMLDEATETQATESRTEDDVAAKGLPRPAVSRAGDQWMLGPHRLLCGEASPDCDVMIRRWQRSTGKAARLAGSDLTFAEVEAARLAEQPPRASVKE